MKDGESEWVPVPTTEEAPKTLKEQLETDTELAGFDFSVLPHEKVRFLSWVKTVQ